MGMKQVPCLPQDYPLFDWADWPKSRAALVSGGLTQDFEMACWNAIVDHLANARTAAGLPWSEYGDIAGNYGPDVSVEDTKIHDGIMRAKIMNRLIRNIKGLYYFRMPWATDPTHPGYIGGYDEFHEDPWLIGTQYVYAEYFIDLVTQLNKVIEIMRGTWPVVAAGQQTVSLSLTVEPGLYAGKSVNFGQGHHLQTNAGITMRSAYGAKIVSPDALAMGTNLNLAIHSSKVGWVYTYMQIAMGVKLTGATLKSGSMHPRVRFFSTKSVVIDAYHPFAIELTSAKESSWATAELHKGQAFLTEARGISTASASVDHVQRLPAPVDANLLFDSYAIVKEAAAAKSAGLSAQGLLHGKTYVAAESSEMLPVTSRTKSETCMSSDPLDQDRSNPISAWKTAASTIDVGGNSSRILPFSAEAVTSLTSSISIVKPHTKPGWAEKNAKTTVSPGIFLTQTGDVSAAKCSTSGCICVLDTAWDAPVWKNGGLWIRQARTVKRKPDGSIDLSGSGDLIAAVQSSMTVITCAVDTLWHPPVWVDGGLLIRQSREVRVLDDGSLDLSGAGDELHVAVSSEVNVSCILDTAWLPPMTVNGGLYIRQSQEAVQNENSELEVM